MDQPTHLFEKAEALRALNGCREAAVDALTRELRSSADPMWQEFGELAERETRGEARQFMDFLETSVSSRCSEPFTRYLLWLRHVLVARHVHPDVLHRCLGHLTPLFEECEPPDVRSALLGLLREAHYALRWYQAPPHSPVQMSPRVAHCDDFEAALLAGDHGRAQATFQQVLETCEHPAAAAIDLVQPALYGIGRKWENNEISVAQEHLATAIVEALLAEASMQGEYLPPNEQNALLALAPGNKHELGLRIVADALEYAGWTTHSLPAHTSARAIIHAVRDERPRLLAVSASLPQHLMAARALFGAVRASLGKHSPHLLLGGLAVNDYPEIARAAGGTILTPDVDSLDQALRQLAQVA